MTLTKGESFLVTLIHRTKGGNFIAMEFMAENRGGVKSGIKWGEKKEE